MSHSNSDQEVDGKEEAKKAKTQKEKGSDSDSSKPEKQEKDDSSLKSGSEGKQEKKSTNGEKKENAEPGTTEKDDKENEFRYKYKNGKRKYLFRSDSSDDMQISTPKTRSPKKSKFFTEVEDELIEELDDEHIVQKPNIKPNLYALDEEDAKDEVINRTDSYVKHKFLFGIDKDTKEEDNLHEEIEFKSPKPEDRYLKNDEAKPVSPRKSNKIDFIEDNDDFELPEHETLLPKKRKVVVQSLTAALDLFTSLQKVHDEKMPKVDPNIIERNLSSQKSKKSQNDSQLSQKDKSEISTKYSQSKSTPKSKNRKVEPDPNTPLKGQFIDFEDEDEGAITVEDSFNRTRRSFRDDPARKSPKLLKH